MPLEISSFYSQVVKGGEDAVYALGLEAKPPEGKAGVPGAKAFADRTVIPAEKGEAKKGIRQMLLMSLAKNLKLTGPEVETIRHRLLGDMKTGLDGSSIKGLEARQIIDLARAQKTNVEAQLRRSLSAIALPSGVKDILVKTIMANPSANEVQAFLQSSGGRDRQALRRVFELALAKSGPEIAPFDRGYLRGFAAALDPNFKPPVPMVGEKEPDAALEQEEPEAAAEAKGVETGRADGAGIVRTEYIGVLIRTNLDRLVADFVKRKKVPAHEAGWLELMAKRDFSGVPAPEILRGMGEDYARPELSDEDLLARIARPFTMHCENILRLFQHGAGVEEPAPDTMKATYDSALTDEPLSQTTLLRQTGGNNCFMQSVHNALLATDGGRAKLQAMLFDFKKCPEGQKPKADECGSSFERFVFDKYAAAGGQTKWGEQGEAEGVASLYGYALDVSPKATTSSEASVFTKMWYDIAATLDKGGLCTLLVGKAEVRGSSGHFVAITSARIEGEDLKVGWRDSLTGRTHVTSLQEIFNTYGGPDMAADLLLPVQGE